MKFYLHQKYEGLIISLCFLLLDLSFALDFSFLSFSLYLDLSFALDFSFLSFSLYLDLSFALDFSFLSFSLYLDLSFAPDFYFSFFTDLSSIDSILPLFCFHLLPGYTVF